MSFNCRIACLNHSCCIFLKDSRYIISNVWVRSCKLSNHLQFRIGSTMNICMQYISTELSLYKSYRMFLRIILGKKTKCAVRVQPQCCLYFLNWRKSLNKRLSCSKLHYIRVLRFTVCNFEFKYLHPFTLHRLCLELKLLQSIMLDHCFLRPLPVFS